MNRDRVARRIGLLPGMFYAGQAITLGRDQVQPSDRDRQRIEQLVIDEEATFAEVKQVIEWLWFDPRAVWWRSKIADVPGFCGNYRYLCDRMDETFTRRGAAAAGFAGPQQPATAGARNIGGDELDRIQAAGLSLVYDDAADDFYVPGMSVNEARQQARAAIERLPERRDLDG